jgi:Mrp family chromosome partitioning ATPase
MHEVLEELTTLADLVIIDAPPLLPVADARILLDHPRVDASLAVARVFKTTRQEARRMRAVFEQHGREPLGAVVTGVKNAPPGMRPNATVNGSGAKNRIRPVPRLGAPREPAGTPKA